MDSFESNKILSDLEAVSAQLKEAREERGLDLRQVSETTGINQKYLYALENSDYDFLPKGIYGRNFLKEYSCFLRLNTKEVLKIFDQERVADKKKKKLVFSNKVVKGKYFLAIPKLVRNLIIIVVVVICLSYLGFYFKKISEPPVLEIVNPINNYITSKTNINVMGHTDPEAKVTINGELVLGDTDGNFNKFINLKKGINAITIVSSKRFGQNTVVVRQVLVKDEELQF